MIKCANCKGSGIVSLGPGIRGVKKCDLCRGAGELLGPVKLCDRCLIASEKLGALAFAAECRAGCVGSITVSIGGGSMAEKVPGPETCQEDCAKVKELEGTIAQLQKDIKKAYSYGC